jgi:hypothetical protein
MNHDIVNEIAIIIVIAFLVRIILLIRTDVKRGKNIFWKLITGLYALYAILPIYTKAKEKKERFIIIISNFSLVVIYLCFVCLILIYFSLDERYSKV